MADFETVFLYSKLLRSYVKIRTVVQCHRHSGNLSSQLLVRTHLKELPMLREIARKLLSKKRQTKKWGNARKSADRLFKLLPKLQKTSKNRHHPASLNTFIWESFRARVVCCTSERYLMGVPATAVPLEHRPYALYSRAAPWAVANAKHKQWAKLYSQFEQRPVLRVTPEEPLTDLTLKRVLKCGSFARLQVLTDLREAGGATLVEFSRFASPADPCQVRSAKDQMS